MQILGKSNGCFQMQFSNYNNYNNNDESNTDTDIDNDNINDFNFFSKFK